MAMASYFGPLEAHLVEFGQSVKAAMPHIGNVYDPMRSNTATWFLPPEQHLVEWIMFNVVCISVFAYNRKVHRWRMHLAADPRDTKDSAWRWVDRALAVSSILVLLATIRFKILSGRVWFLLQPCHLQNLALVLFGLSRSKFAGKMFNIYMHAQFGAWLAILGPDTSELLLPGEVFSFFFQHALLVGAPLYYIARRRYPMYERRALYSWSMYTLFHADVLVPVSLFSGFNMNYTFNPPPGVLADMGVAYRAPSLVAFILLEIICRDILMEGWCRLLHKHEKHYEADFAEESDPDETPGHGKKKPHGD